MKTNQTTIFVAVCILCFLLYRCTSAANEATGITGDSPSSDANLYAGYATQTDWGSHLVTICVCGDCHTPKKMTDKGPVADTSLMLSGHPSQTPPPVLSRPDQVARALVGAAWHGAMGYLLCSQSYA